MKKFLALIFTLLIVETTYGQRKPIGCRQGDNFILVGSSSCNRFTCQNPAALAYCYRTYKPRNNRGTRFQEANPHCVQAFCRKFFEEGRQDKRGETYRERYEEFALRNNHIPSLKLVEDLYEVLCNEDGKKRVGEPYNADLHRQLFFRINMSYLENMKRMKPMNRQNPFLDRLKNFGLAGVMGVGGNPMMMNGGMNQMGGGMNQMDGGMSPVMINNGMGPMMNGGVNQMNGMPPGDICDTISYNNRGNFGNGMSQGGYQNQNFSNDSYSDPYDDSYNDTNPYGDSYNDPYMGA